MSVGPALPKTPFLVLALAMLLVGIILFGFADSLATLPANTRAGNLWPWPIGPLALRFVAALFFAGSLVAYLVSRRPDRTTVAFFFSVISILSGMLLLHFFANTGSIDWAKPLAYLWPGVLGVAFLASLMLTARARRKAIFTVPPLPPTPRVARNIALFIVGLTGIVGATMFFLPDVGRERWPWDLANNTNVQLLGSVFLTVALSSLLTYLQPSWYGADLFYPGAATFSTIALIASFMHWNLFTDKPLTSILFVVIYIIGAIMGFYPYFRHGISLANSPMGAGSQ